jgi:hypothetical protein
MSNRPRPVHIGAGFGVKRLIVGASRMHIVSVRFECTFGYRHVFSLLSQARGRADTAKLCTFDVSILAAFDGVSVGRGGRG